MKAIDLRNLSIEELQDKATQLKKNLLQFRFQSKTGKLETKNSLTTTRRDIARILTVINEQKRGAVVAPVKPKTVKAVKPAAAKKTAEKKKTVKKKPAKSAKA